MTDLNKSLRICMLAQMNRAENGTVSWIEIVGAVRKAGFVIRNWMVVRNVLQSFINDSLLTRTKDTHHEIYTINQECPVCAAPQAGSPECPVHGEQP